MRKITLLFLALLPILGISQADLPIKDEKITFSEVVDIAGKSKSDLFSDGKKFFKTTFKRSTTLKEANETEGKLQGESFIGFEGIEGKVQYDIIISVKDGRYKYTFTNFIHQNYTKGKCSGSHLEREEPKCATGKMSAKTWSSIKINTKTEVKKLVEKIKASMASATVKETNEDW